MRKSIGLQNESTLHADLKNWYQLPGDKFEFEIDNFIIDIVRENYLIEIQTGNFSSIKKKLQQLCFKHKVRMIYPLPLEKQIVYLSTKGNQIRKRKSPKHCKIQDIFHELVYIPHLLKNHNFSLEVLFTSEEEIRCNDGKGSWRRKGVSILDRRLIEVLKSEQFLNLDDYLQFIPFDKGVRFLTKEVAEFYRISINLARKITYTLSRCGVIENVGKKGNALVYSKLK